MKVKARIINMPESRIEGIQENLKICGIDGYKLRRKSIVEDLNNLNNIKTNVFENGIVIEFKVDPYVVVVDRLGYGDTDEDYIGAPAEYAELYILDNGEVYYVHKGYTDGTYRRYEFYETGGMEFNTEQIIQSLKEKLGKEYLMEEEIDVNKISLDSYIDDIKDNIKNNNIKLRNKKILMDQKVKRLVSLVKNSIKKGEYEETLCSYDPETKTVSEEILKKAI